MFNSLFNLTYSGKRTAFPVSNQIYRVWRMYTVAVVQLTANEDIERNFRVCEKFTKQAKAVNAAIIFFSREF